MKLWVHWLAAVLQLRSSCSRCRTFLWFITCVADMSVRIDLLGITSIVRAFGLQESCYDRILDFFHGSSLKLENLHLFGHEPSLRSSPNYQQNT